ncbi:putative RNA-directed DNA polymerase from transposon BS [Trichonephila clavipes]|nr:putative RNA-directed DNA polymerase from transposon BS [Trichonephila clavipes]
MNSTLFIANAASVVTQSKKDRVPGLGRGPDSINNLRFPNSLKIIQFNINGISTSATRIKLDQVLELALTEGAQIIALQETKLKTFTSLKIKRSISLVAVNDEQAAGLLGSLSENVTSIKDRNIKIRANREDTQKCSARGCEFLNTCTVSSWPERDIVLIRGRFISIKNAKLMVPMRVFDLLIIIIVKIIGLEIFTCIPTIFSRKPFTCNHTVAAFLDLSKAFDRVWNNFLVIKLFKVFGIGGKVLPWIYDVLRNRLIRVKFNNSLSRSFSFFQGVPQGSVLSPTLFSLYSLIESVIKRKCEFGAFVDDIVFWKTDSDLTKLEKLYNFQPNIFLYNQPLNIVKHPKYLSFILDPEILGNKHIDNIVFKARKWLNIVRYIFERDWGADAGTLRNTYISLIRPILEYSVPVYCSASVTNLQKLEKVQLSAARIITGLKNTCPRDIVLFEADLQPPLALGDEHV